MEHDETSEMHPNPVWAFAIFLTMVLASAAADAQTGTVVPQTRSGGSIGAGQVYLGRTLFGAIMDDEVVRDGTRFDSGERAWTFRGLDASGSPGETRFASRITSQTQPLRFGASASLSLIEPRVNRLNPPHVLRDATGGYAGVDPDGMPDYFHASAFAYLSDDVAVVSAHAVTHVRLNLSMQGRIELPEGFPDDRVSVSTVLHQVRGQWPDTPLFPALRFYPGRGSHASDLWTQPIPVAEGRFGFGLSLSSEILAAPETAEDEGRNWSFTVDFLDGVTINYVQGFDSRGEPVTLSSATGAFGTRYPTAPVPEPGTLASILVGLGVLGVACRRRMPAWHARASCR